MINSNISVFENINRQMQELHELEMQLTQIDNQLYDILIDNSVNTDVRSDVGVTTSVDIGPDVNNNIHNNISIDNNVSLYNNNRQSVKTDNNYLNRYTSIKDPRIMRLRTYNINDAENHEYVSKVFDMQ